MYNFRNKTTTVGMTMKSKATANDVCNEAFSSVLCELTGKKQANQGHAIRSHVKQAGVSRPKLSYKQNKAWLLRVARNRKMIEDQVNGVTALAKKQKAIQAQEQAKAIAFARAKKRREGQPLTARIDNLLEGVGL